MLEPGGVMILEDIPNEQLLQELTNLFSPEEQKGIRIFDVRESGRFDDLDLGYHQRVGMSNLHF